MKAFFKGPMFRALLALLAFVVVSLLVWYLGPFLALGDTHPLGSAAVRVSVILLLFAALLAWVLDVSATVAWSLIGAAALCLLIWHGGPLLGLGSVHPLASVWARVLCIAVVLLAVVVWGLLKLYRALQQDEKLLQRLLQREGVKPAVAREEVRHLADRARQALMQLRQMHLTLGQEGGSVWAAVRRLVEGKRYLYELPWYILIGKPGAGKSSVVLNAGLTFPLPEQMGAASSRLMLQQSTGTQQCDWWLTNEAVFLDTAGRYTEHEAADETAQAINQAEWKGFLGVLRQARPRAPINGALLVVDLVELLHADEAQRMSMAAQFRARLEELRSQLGIRFPVYLILAKADVLQGFTAYFSSLTAEARTQVWGFTLPWVENSSALDKLGEKAAGHLRSKKQSASDASVPPPQALSDSALLAQKVGQEFSALVERVRAGVMGRLQEEFELDQRQSLYLLPYEMQALEEPLQALVQSVFAESRYDATQIQPTLRGVYLTSAMQSGQEVVAQPVALLARLQKTFKKWGDVMASVLSRRRATSRKSFFLTDLMQRVVFTEAHLVKPNLRWEARIRVMRWIGHGAVLFVFFWLSGALTLSFNNNKDYLQDVSQKTTEMTQQMQNWLSDNRVEQADRVLNMARGLPLHAGLDLDSPGISYQYGLYVAEDIHNAAQDGYGRLLDRLVLPHVVAHLEKVMREAVVANDAQSAYRALRVYLLLHDGQKFAQSSDHARDVRQWVAQEWQHMDRLGNSVTMVGHLEALFSGRRTVQSASAANEGLVRQVRDYLEKQPSTERLYERIKQSLLPVAGREFSLTQVLGPQSAFIFSRASGASVERGVPGLFTYDGYHDVFSKRLPTLLVAVQQDDMWVMGASEKDAASANRTSAEQRSDQRDLIDEVRRRYLQEYANLWGDFLDDIRLVQSDPSATLAYEINMVRQLAAADSPLIRLARIGARETTLSRPLFVGDGAQRGQGGQVRDALESSGVQANLGARPEQRLERQWVDDRFAALREVVVGQPDDVPGATGSKVSLEAMGSALNQYYSVLVVADTAIAAGSLPPVGTEAALKLRIEAGKLPPPLREVLLGVSQNAGDKVAQGAASILRMQAQNQLDRLLGLMTINVVEVCQRLIAGRYPFANTAQEVSADDFNTFFAKGGAADDFFQKYLVSLVDTSVRPWRYKTAAAAQTPLGAAPFSLAQAPAPVQDGPTLLGELLALLSQSALNPEVFAQIAQIRDMFFRQHDGRRLGWKGEYRVVSLDDKVTEWVIDIDGQVQRYAHGPIQATALEWPGPRGGTMAEMHALPRIQSDTSSSSARGPWAWMRLMEQGKLVPSTQPGKQAVEFVFDGRRAVMEITSAGPSPFNSTLLRNFTCPARG